MLYIDIGNSFIKIASHVDDIIDDLAPNPASNGDNWVTQLRARHDQIDDVISLLNTEMVKMMPVLACSVVENISELLQKKLGKRIRFVQVSDLPAEVLNYDTPHTLGIDRFLACFGARSLSAGGTVLVIDAGTATTIDLMDSKGVFQGGVITAGLGIFEDGLRSHAPALPEVEREIPSVWPPKNTTQALQWGIAGTYTDIVKAHVERFKKDWPDAQIWVTGGDAPTLAQIRSLQLHYHPNLVLEGLRNWNKSQ
ncbi:MAG: type III pantothenate kinase [Balneolales bacterium]|nr:type III pantothenate kinase [Balneolales bacterium]